MDGRNGHVLEFDKISHYQGSTTHVWCVNENCYLDTRSEHYIRDIVDELMEEPCPIDPDRCINCDRPIVKDTDYCQYCRLRPGRAIRDLDEEGQPRDHD